MQVCTSLQTDNHASTPPLSFLQAGCPSGRPTNSVKALKAQCTEPITNSFVQIAKLKLTTIDNSSSVNCTNKFLIGAVCQNAPMRSDQKVLQLGCKQTILSFFEIFSCNVRAFFDFSSQPFMP